MEPVEEEVDTQEEREVASTLNRPCAESQPSTGYHITATSTFTHWLMMAVAVAAAEAAYSEIAVVLPSDGRLKCDPGIERVTSEPPFSPRRSMRYSSRSGCSCTMRCQSGWNWNHPASGFPVIWNVCFAASSLMRRGSPAARASSSA